MPSNDWRETLGHELALMAYLDVANIFGWKKRLGWSVRIVRLIRQLKMMPNIKAIKAYFGTNERSMAASRALHEDMMAAGAFLRTKPVKYIQKTIDESMFFKKTTLSQLDVGTTTLVDSVVAAVRSSGVVIEEPKCNFDAEITMDMIDDADLASGFMLFSGDSDFYAPLERLKLKGRHIYVIGARRAVAKELFRVADMYIDIRKFYQRNTTRESVNPAFGAGPRDS